MNKKVLKIRLIIIGFILLVSVSANSQIKVANNGYVGIRTSSTPSYYLDAQSPFSVFHRYSDPNYYGYHLQISLWGSDPRIQSKNKVVFYSSNSNNHINIECQTLIETSDSSAKEDIIYMKGQSLEKVLKLKGVTYKWKNKDGHKSAKNKKEIGFIAQEVEEIIPEVVYSNDSTQEKLLAYTHLIPVLTEAIKELNDKIVFLENDLAKKTEQKSGDLKSSNKTYIYSEAQLFQNAPNPFNESTIIKYVTPSDCQNATINIFDMQGVPIKNIQLSLKGIGEIVINSNELNAGMYIYALIVDGKIIDSKNMILTK